VPLAPIRGAPPGAPIPDFPSQVPKSETTHPTVAAATEHHHPEKFPPRRSYAPVEIHCDGSILTFKVIPELPAISRSSMVIHVSADTTEGCPPHMLASFAMSPVKAERFLTELRNDYSPIVVRSDTGESMEIACEFTDSGLVFIVQESSRGTALRRFPVDRTFDVRAMADHLLANLGTSG
jgi:hypothetical protein